jgi:site-specific DNA-methyltransferase (adenine-specific)
MSWTIHSGDCLEVMRGMADNSFDAIVTDPPYFKVKGEAWDRQWDKPAQFLAWLDTIAEQWQRLLKPNGSLYCFASSKMASRVECLIAERFNVLNRITWQKDAGWAKRQCKEELRIFFPASEALVFAEHYGADNIAKGEAGYANKCDELRGFVFEPLRAYLDGERQRAGITPRQVNEYTNTQMAGHWFTRVQWALPTAKHYAAIRELFQLRGNWKENTRQGFLRREYEDLRREYEDLRRPFWVTADVPYTDVWTFPTVQHYKGKHPCEKPLAMMEHIIRASTRPGAVVLDCFAGSGATGEACLSLGREFIGIEKDPAYAGQARRRLRAVLRPSLQLF